MIHLGEGLSQWPEQYQAALLLGIGVLAIGLLRGWMTRVPAIAQLIAQLTGTSCNSNSLSSNQLKLLETVPTGVFLVGAQQEIFWCNSRAADLLGLGKASSTGCTLTDLVQEIILDDQPISQPIHSLIESLWDNGQPMWDAIISWRHPATSEARWLLTSIQPERDATGKVRHLICTIAHSANPATSITESPPSEPQPEQSLQLTPLVSMEWDLNFQVRSWSPGAAQIFGYSTQEAIGQTVDFLVPPESKAYVNQAWQDLIALRGGTRSIHASLTKDGRTIICEWYNTPLVDRHGKVMGAASFVQDVTERTHIEQQLLQNAFYDDLTGLPNRNLFIDRLSQAIEQAKAHSTLLAVLFLDLDRFKVVNDSLGHRVGDHLLVGVVKRLQGCLRTGDTVARLGGDEFAILLENICDVKDAIRIAERIQKAVKLPFNLNGHEVFTTASIGIAVNALGHEQPEQLLRDADTAMYRAKAQGKARYEVFSAAMHTYAVARLHLENDLRHAIQRQEFVVYYQPIISLQSCRIKGFEALVRWQHPERGMVSPGEFIPVAEETDLIVPLGAWVLQEACQQMQRWQEQFSVTAPWTVSVNLSGRQLARPDLSDRIQEILLDTKLNPQKLSLEITESVLMENAEAAAAVLSQLQALGLRLSIDDFGTGYSSLAYLHHFPIDTLKIDRSFVNRVDTDAEKLAIIRTIVTLAWNLGMDVVAEGVETSKQLSQLRSLKCESGQGYFFAKPMDPQATTAFIEKNCRQSLCLP